MSDLPTILIADDSAGQRKLLELMLSDFQVVTAENGDDVLNYLEHGSPDLLLLDLNMPFASGLEICKQVKESLKLASPVVIMTSLTDEKTQKAVTAAQADALLYKPVDRTTPRETLERLLNQT